MRVLTWNVDAPAQTVPKASQIESTIRQLNADIICLTEAFPHNISENQHIIASNKQSVPTSRWGNVEEVGAVKVILWSRWAWDNIDTIGSDRLPAGRFIYGQTTPSNCDPLHIIGLGIPWAAYRDAHCTRNWDGFKRYVSVLKEDILPRLPKDRTIIMGDLNMRFNARSMQGVSKEGQRALLDALKNYEITTAGLVDPNSGKNMVDHIILSADLSLQRVVILRQIILNDAPHAPVIADIVI